MKLYIDEKVTGWRRTTINVDPEFSKNVVSDIMTDGIPAYCEVEYSEYLDGTEMREDENGFDSVLEIMDDKYNVIASK